MKEEAKELRTDVEKLYEQTVSYCYSLHQILEQLDEQTLTDVGFLMRECERLFDDARKEAKAKKETVSRLLAIKILKRYTEDPDTELRSRGELATATPDVAIRPKLPKAGTPEYSQLLEFLGIPADVISAGTLSIHFNRMTEMLTELAAAGKNPPPGLLGTYTDNTCTFRKRR